jgi:hypothetical protein
MMTDTHSTAMRLVSRRPRFTAGMPVADFAAIKTVLYCDAECEVYLLDAAGGGNVLLIGLRGSGPEPTAATQLDGWLARQGVDALARPALSSDAHDIVVRVHGRWMAGIATFSMLESELYGLLTALIELATAAAAVDLTAVPVAPLLWVDGSPQDCRLTSIYVRPAGGDEASVVRQIGETFLWAATGIASLEHGSAAADDRLEAWCQNADADLSHIVAQCLGAATPIATLRELQAEVAGCLVRRERINAFTQESASEYVNLSPRRYLWRSRTS